MKVKVDGKEVELVDQIQLYATNEQLVYPFVSPIWQPSLGGLPPLYVMAGDKEVLRDEIIYVSERVPSQLLRRLTLSRSDGASCGSPRPLPRPRGHPQAEP